MELGHLLTRSGLTYPEVSSKWFVCTNAVILVLGCHRTTEKEEEEAAKKEKKERNKERKEKERKQRKEEDEDGEGVWERVKGGIIPTVSTFQLFVDGLTHVFGMFVQKCAKVKHFGEILIAVAMSYSIFLVLWYSPPCSTFFYFFKVSNANNVLRIKFMPLSPVILSHSCYVSL